MFSVRWSLSFKCLVYQENISPEYKRLLVDKKDAINNGLIKDHK